MSSPTGREAPSTVRTSLPESIAQVVYKLIPGFDDEALLTVSSRATKLRAIVLELYGTGGSPSRKQEFLHFVKAGDVHGDVDAAGVLPTGLLRSVIFTLALVYTVRIVAFNFVFAGTGGPEANKDKHDAVNRADASNEWWMSSRVGTDVLSRLRRAGHNEGVVLQGTGRLDILLSPRAGVGL